MTANQRTSTSSESQAWADDVRKRELVLTRVYDAPRERVFSAWVEPTLLSEWFCPEDFTSQTHEIDLRVGGKWRFAYVAPDGTTYENRIVFLRIEEPSLIEFEHGSDKDDDPGRFRVLVTFDEQSNGKTVLTLRQLHPSEAQRNATLGFGAVEIGCGTLGKLDQILSRLAA